MKSLIFLTLPVILLALSPFESRYAKNYDLSMFETHKIKEFCLEDTKVKCFYICNKKKISKKEKIADAISFYKNSKDYSFSYK